MAEWPILVMVLQEILSMRETESKMDLLAIDDFNGELQQLIDWAIRMKNDDGFADMLAMVYPRTMVTFDGL